eukprot:CAMPEP_0194397436 /NCGR_PEP_ID=MMETSP0174-20130528/125541_1 /TAXON_ID=216777 /ORGANISM="Proboscia alata, Strain PI-D3" /LENGTH=199 /DNA_ID=CAMNT_0039193609 /DNA_START=1149 /DNA_END=1745 /DNA_ORIENTATION=-
MVPLNKDYMSEKIHHSCALPLHEFFTCCLDCYTDVDVPLQTQNKLDETNYKSEMMSDEENSATAYLLNKSCEVHALEQLETNVPIIDISKLVEQPSFQIRPFRHQNNKEFDNTEEGKEKDENKRKLQTKAESKPPSFHDSKMKARQLEYDMNCQRLFRAERKSKMQSGNDTKQGLSKKHNLIPSKPAKHTLQFNESPIW